MKRKGDELSQNPKRFCQDLVNLASPENFSQDIWQEILKYLEDEEIIILRPINKKAAQAGKEVSPRFIFARIFNNKQKAQKNIKFSLEHAAQELLDMRKLAHEILGHQNYKIILDNFRIAYLDSLNILYNCAPYLRQTIFDKYPEKWLQLCFLRALEPENDLIANYRPDYLKLLTPTRELSLKIKLISDLFERNSIDLFLLFEFTNRIEYEDNKLVKENIGNMITVASLHTNNPRVAYICDIALKYFQNIDNDYSITQIIYIYGKLAMHDKVIEVYEKLSARLASSDADFGPERSYVARAYYAQEKFVQALEIFEEFEDSEFQDEDRALLKLIKDEVK